MSNVSRHSEGACSKECLPACESIQFVRNLDSISTDPGNACLVPDFFKAVQDGDQLEAFKIRKSFEPFS